MIELKISGNILEYVDVEELKEQAAREVRYAIKENVSKIFKEDKLQKEILTLIIDQIKNDVFSNDLVLKLREEIFQQIDNLSDFDMTYHTGLNDVMKAVTDENRTEIQMILKQKTIDYMNTQLRIGDYEVRMGLQDLIKEAIIERKHELNFDEIIENLVSTGLESLVYR